MDEEQPGPDEVFDDDVYVRAWWQRSAYFHGTQEQRDDKAGYALDWAEEGIQRMMRNDDPDGVVSLLWRLTEAPEADPEVVAECVMKDLLEDRAAELDDQFLSMCETYPRFRAAVAALHLEPEQIAALPLVRPYLTLD